MDINRIMMVYKFLILVLLSSLVTKGIAQNTNVNECESSPCQNGASCNDEDNHFVCDCSQGFSGKTCEIDSNKEDFSGQPTRSYCSCSPCLNGGTCIGGGRYQYSCICPKGYSGRNCETNSQTNSWTETALNIYKSVSKNCRQVISDGGVFLTSNSSDRTDNGMCRVLLQEVVTGVDYNFSASVNADFGNKGYPGVIYNAKDLDNFDFVILPIEQIQVPQKRQAGPPSCFITGFMRDGRAQIVEIYPCEQGQKLPAPSENQYVTGKIRKTGSKIITFSNTNVSPVFPLVGRIGFLAMNQDHNVIRVQGARLYHPYVEVSQLNLSPSYGPLAGQTNITITGKNLPVQRQDPFVKIGARACTIISSSSHQIVASTPAFYDGWAVIDKLPAPESEPGYPLLVQAIFENPGIVISPKEKFTYKGNPKITDFMPKDTIVAGGVAITVTGSSLTSVQKHIQIITMLHKRKRKQGYVTISEREFSSVCTVVNSEKMICPTPPIVLPEGFSHLSSFDEEDTPSLSEGNTPQRKKRDVDEQIRISEHDIGAERLEFYVSYKSDGVDTFKSQTKENVIVVFANPSFETFEPRITRYDPNAANPFIRIKGKHLRIGIREDDYSIHIGIGRCVDIQLTDNILTCLPPGSEPQHNSSLGNIFVNSAAEVMVHAGYDPTYIGHLDYTGVRRSGASGLFHGLCTSIIAFTFLMQVLDLTIF